MEQRENEETAQLDALRHAVRTGIADIEVEYYREVSTKDEVRRRFSGLTAEVLVDN